MDARQGLGGRKKKLGGSARIRILPDLPPWRSIPGSSTQTEASLIFFLRELFGLRECGADSHISDARNKRALAA